MIIELTYYDERTEKEYELEVEVKLGTIERIEVKNCPCKKLKAKILVWLKKQDLTDI